MKRTRRTENELDVIPDVPSPESILMFGAGAGFMHGPTPDPQSPPSPNPAPSPSGQAPRGRLDRIPGYTVPAILSAVPLMVAILARLAPGTVYDHFVWPYFWGPIKADALGLGPTQTLDFHGVAAHSGYNVINTASWAVLLGVCLLGLAQLLRRLRTVMDERLILGATAWVVAGSLFHVLEDTGLFQPPLQYIFITPPIYLLFAAFGVASLLVGHWLRHAARRGLGAAHARLAILLGCLAALWSVLWLTHASLVTHILNPFVVAGIAAATWLVAKWRIQARGTVDPTETVQILGGGAILLALAYVASYATHPWPSLAGGLPDSAKPIALLAVPLALAPVAACLLWAKLHQRSHPQSPAAQAFLRPINLLLVFGQMLDAFATALAIDGYGYDEKHVLSRGVIDAAQRLYASLSWDFGAQHPTFLGFVPLKLLVSLAVVAAIDSGREGERHPTLIGLVKFAIIMVGLGPGLRDLTRLALGV